MLVHKVQFWSQLLLKFKATNDVKSAFLRPETVSEMTCWRQTPVKKKLSSNERARKMQNNRAITDLNAPNSSRDIPFQKSRIWARWTSPFCRFSASFSLKYDVIDVTLQDTEKTKVQYLRSRPFDMFETLQAIRN